MGLRAPAEKAAMRALQRESWVRGEMGMHDETTVVRRDRTVAPGRDRTREGNQVVVTPPGSGDFSIGGELWPGLSKLIEEAGEVMQVAGKLIGSEGRTDHWSGDIRTMLIEELGDLQAAMDFFVHHNLADDKQAIEDRVNAKVARFQDWHRDGLARRHSDATL